MSEEDNSLLLSGFKSSAERNYSVEPMSAGKLTEKAKTDEKLVLFLSFDLDDFTEMKSKEQHWPQIVESLVDTPFEGRRPWKFVGDEVIYAIRVTSLLLIVDCISLVEKHLKKLNNAIGEKISKMGEVGKMDPTPKNITAKATIWLARVNQGNDWEDNLERKIGGVYTDYIGKNVDEGFRLTSYTDRYKIAIDPKIVFALLIMYNLRKNKDIGDSDRNKIKAISKKFTDDIGKADLDKGKEENVYKILDNIIGMGYTTLKGVWNNSPYPIFWYCMGSDGTGTTNHHDGNRKIFNGHKLDDAKEYGIMKMDKYKALTILKDTFSKAGDSDGDKVYNEVKEVLKRLKVTESSRYPDPVMSKLYYVALCCNPETKNVLIAKRSASCWHLKNVWEFGTVPLENMDMLEVIKAKYKESFGIVIEIITDKEMGVDDEGNPKEITSIKPLSCRTIFQSGGRHEAILVCAKIKGVSHRVNGDMLEGKDLNDERKVIEYIESNINKNRIQRVNFVNFNRAKEEFIELSIDRVKKDSDNCTSNLKQEQFDNRDVEKTEYCIPLFSNSIKRAIEEMEMEREKERESH